jgi:hypothetical protein
VHPSPPRSHQRHRCDVPSSGRSACIEGGGVAFGDGVAAAVEPEFGELPGDLRPHQAISWTIHVALAHGLIDEHNAAEVLQRLEPLST